MYSKKKAEFTPLYISLTSTLKKIIITDINIIQKEKNSRQHCSEITVSIIIVQLKNRKVHLLQKCSI